MLTLNYQKALLVWSNPNQSNKRSALQWNRKYSVDSFMKTVTTLSVFTIVVKVCYLYKQWNNWTAHYIDIYPISELIKTSSNPAWYLGSICAIRTGQVMGSRVTEISKYTCENLVVKYSYNFVLTWYAFCTRLGAPVWYSECLQIHFILYRGSITLHSNYCIDF